MNIPRYVGIHISNSQLSPKRSNAAANIKLRLIHPQYVSIPRSSFNQEAVITFHTSSSVPILSERPKLERNLAYIYIYIYMYIYTCIHTYIYTYTHIHIHTYDVVRIGIPKMKPTVNSSEDRQAKLHINMVDFSYFYCNTEISVSYGYIYLNASALTAYYTQGKNR
jgi:hypothetical protein